MKTTLTSIICGAVLLTGILPAIGATKSKTTSKASVVEKSQPKIPAAEKKLVSDLTTTQKSKLLTLLNEGAAKELVVIPGIAKVRAEEIVKARPFKAVEEVTLVRGIGKATFAKVISHGKSLTQRSSSKKG